MCYVFFSLDWNSVYSSCSACT